MSDCYTNKEHDLFNFSNVKQQDGSISDLPNYSTLAISRVYKSIKHKHVSKQSCYITFNGFIYAKAKERYRMTQRFLDTCLLFCLENLKCLQIG